MAQVAHHRKTALAALDAAGIVLTSPLVVVIARGNKGTAAIFATTAHPKKPLSIDVTAMDTVRFSERAAWVVEKAREQLAGEPVKARKRPGMGQRRKKEHA